MDIFLKIFFLFSERYHQGGVHTPGQDSLKGFLLGVAPSVNLFHPIERVLHLCGNTKHAVTYILYKCRRQKIGSALFMLPLFHL